MTEADDWRTIVELTDEHHRTRLLDGLRGRRLANEARERVGERVLVSHDGPRVFMYTDTAASAHAVADIAGELLAEHDLHGTIEVTRWHPLEQRWDDPEKPMPQTEGERAAEVARGGEADRERSRRQGFPEWDVRILFPTRDDAVAFERRLEAEGIPVARRDAAMIAGAETEGEANALADRIRAEAPPEARISVEVNRTEAMNEAHPFAFLGGLAG